MLTEVGREVVLSPYGMFCYEFNYEEYYDLGGGEAYGFFQTDRGCNSLSREDLNVIAYAVFTTRPDCKWFEITQPLTKCLYTNRGNYWPGLAVEQTVEDGVAGRYIRKHNFKNDMTRDMHCAITDYGPSAIGITPEQYRAGIRALALYRARSHVKRIPPMEVIKKFEEYLDSL